MPPHAHTMHQPEGWALPKVTEEPQAVTFGYLTRITMETIKIILPQSRREKLT